MIRLPEPTLAVPRFLGGIGQPGRIQRNGDDEWLYCFDQPGKVWGANARLHFMARSQLVNKWRKAAATGGAEWLPRLTDRWYVQCSLPFRRGGRRDPHNYSSTVCKAVVDGLVDAGVWPDDDPEYVYMPEPICRVIRKGTHPLVGVHAWRWPR